MRGARRQAERGGGGRRHPDLDVMEPRRLRDGAASEQKIMPAGDNCGNVGEFKSMPVDKVFARQGASVISPYLQSNA